LFHLNPPDLPSTTFYRTPRKEMARTKGNSKTYKKATQSRIPSPSRSPSLASYHTTPSPSPPPSPKQTTSTHSSNLPDTHLFVIPNLESTDTVYIPINVFNEQQLQQFADQNRGIHVDVVGNFGICTRIPPTPLSPASTPLPSTGNPGEGLVQCSEPPLLQPHHPIMDNALPNPESNPPIVSHPRDPPKTFAKVVSGTTPHTPSYDANNGPSVQLRCPPPSPNDVVSIPQPVAFPSYPSERAGVPRDIQQRNLECNSTQRIKEDSRPPRTNPSDHTGNPAGLPIPNPRTQAIQLWQGYTPSSAGPLFAVANGPAHSNRFETEYIHNSTDREHWSLIADSFRQRESLRRDYDDATHRTTLLTNLARSTGLPEAFARYIRENQVDTLPHRRRTGPAPERAHNRPNPTPIPTPNRNELPPPTVPHNDRRTPRGQTSLSQGNVEATGKLHKGTHATRKATPTEPRAMKDFDPNAFCRKCERMRLPAQGHWASHCIHTTCPTCYKKKPEHYKWSCPEYICSICKRKNPQHKHRDCPELPTQIERTEALRSESLGMHNARAEIESYDFDDGVSMDYSTISR
jgi:hypothetical protein